MINIKIEDLLQKYASIDDNLKIKKAYDYANEKLKGVKRKNGDDNITHCLEVAFVLTNLNVDSTCIQCALLHDVFDYCDINEDEFISLFGTEVYKITQCVSKINKLEMNDDSEDSAIYLRKVMVGLSEDVRVLFIKLADRLCNMRTLDIFPKEYQKKIASETLSVLVPIAHRLGINYIKSELENLCLYYSNPNVYNDILEKLNETTAKLNECLKDMKDSISHLLIENGIKFEIKGRVKSVYSIYNKLSNGKKWDDIYDILALRVFVEKESECYAVVGIIHSKYRPLQHRFKDYIAIPKENMYQSLHTTVIGEGGRKFEIQIRTYEMDEIAEKGIASHWSYKEKGTKKIQSMMEQKLELYRSIIENSTSSEDNEFKKVIDEDILGELIYVFTPKGDVVELPQGSTTIDFAYRIHSKVGDTMIGAIVNDQMVPITHTLNENDIVKIMTNPTAKPNKDWLNYVKTTQAKNKIKAYFSKIDRDDYINKGKTILEREMRRRHLAFGDVFSQDNMQKFIQELKFKDIDDLYLAVGSFRYTANYIINLVLGPEEISDGLVTKKSSDQNLKKSLDVLVDEKASILTHLAKCCKPVKGDEITGIITKTDGIAIHRKECHNIIDMQEKAVSVSWNENSLNLYIANLYVVISSSKNKLSDLIKVITTEKINIVSIDNVSDEKDNHYNISVKVHNTKEIDKLIKSLSHLRYVKDVKRI